MRYIITIVLSIALLGGCASTNEEELNRIEKVDEKVTVTDSNPIHAKVEIINKDGIRLVNKIKPPLSYTRIELEGNSFGSYLRNFKLKPHGSKVHYYNGEIKSRDVHVAVLDMDVGDKDLQQCADSIIRLRADYLYEEDRFEDISFNLTNGFQTPYKKWMNGYRVKVKGNTTTWIKKYDNNENDYKVLKSYLEFIYSYAGTLSLSKELKSVDYMSMKVGDVFIRGGSPGHGIIVMDMAVNDEGERIYMLAQGYMPAQEMHVLLNPRDKEMSPWYKLDENDTEIITPEWTFTTSELKRF